MSSEPTGYVLGQSERAARRLQLQDQQFAVPTELLLDALSLQPTDRIVELGCGPGGLTRRILSRLQSGGVVVGVDASQGLLDVATRTLAGVGGGRFEPVLADVSSPGPWLNGADVLIGRAVLHHVPMAEYFLGRVRPLLRTGTRIGFIEPDFRSPLGRLALLESTSRPELTPLRVWATVINELYLARRISPDVGATLGRTLELAGYRQVQSHWYECDTDHRVIENISMFYEEVRDTLHSLGILSREQVDEQQKLLRSLPAEPMPSVWGLFRVTAVV
jgi:ubiquinone/menaquinone biosynthesis C-methylase UbiE